MNNTFDQPVSEQFNVFHVTQLATDSFLDKVLGLDYIYIRPNSISEIHRHNNSDNLIFILSGKAIIILNSVEHEISPGLRVHIPRGMWHGFRTHNVALEFISAQIPPILNKADNVFDREVQV